MQPGRDRPSALDCQLMTIAELEERQQFIKQTCCHVRVRVALHVYGCARTATTYYTLFLHYGRIAFALPSHCGRICLFVFR